MSRKLIVEIVGDASSLERAFKKSEKSAKGFSGTMDKSARRGRRTFGSLSRGVAGLAGGFIGAYGLTSVTRAAFSEMAEAQKVTAQTNAVLKSTGRVAGVSAKHVDDLGTALMTVSGVDDEVIKQGENMLLTFRDIRNATGKGNKIFDQATRAALDMSVATGGDMTQSALRLGKALNDPIKGVGSLARVGVQFTDAQKEQIKALTESGRKMEAQKIILRELNKEFGGSAKAAGQTLSGKLNILRNTLLNLGGTLATILTPEVTKLVDKMVDWLSKTKNQKTIIAGFKSAVSVLKDAIHLLKGAFDLLNGVTGDTKTTFKILLGFFVTFKALKLAAYFARMAAAMKLFAGASATASAAGAGGVLGPGGKAGKVGKVGRMGKFARLGAGAGRMTLPGTIAAMAYQLPHPRALDRSGLSYLKQGLGFLHGGGHGDTSVQIDGHEVARLTARHHDAQMARRRRQRAAQRRSVR